jgi:RNA polymerase sigma-70 factor (ECF subfamily)
MKMPFSDDLEDDHARFLSLFLRSEREVFRYVLALVPEPGAAREIVQSAAIELWRKFADYDPARPFTPWACRFALRQAQAHLRRTQRWRTMLDDTLVETLAEERSRLDEAMERRFVHLEACLEKLPSPQREAVHLYYHDEAALPDMAARLGRSVDALYKMLQRARRSLFDCMTAAEAAEESE